LLHGLGQRGLQADAVSHCLVKDDLADLALLLITDRLALAVGVDAHVRDAGRDFAVLDACGRSHSACAKTLTLGLASKRQATAIAARSSTTGRM
jgi:hypothetical protein